MAKLNFKACFKSYGASIINPMWAVSAQAEDGSIVISCWEAYMSRPDKDTLRYTDTLSRWDGNANGNSLLRSHLELAKHKALPIRLIIAKASDMGPVNAGMDASEVPKTFHTKPEVAGSLTSFDGDMFVIDFKKI